MKVTSGSPNRPLREYLAHKQEIDAAIAAVLSSGCYVLGEEVCAFEQEFASYIGTHYAFGVANGTDAISIALKASGIKPGQKVATVSHTAVATVSGIELAGAQPVLVDIESDYYTMDVVNLAMKLRHHHEGGDPIRAIVPVHLYGHMADMVTIMRLAQEYKAFVVEDCAQAHGAKLHGKRAGQWGNAAAFSFYPTKNLGAIGDGGAIVTNDCALADRIELIRQYGWRERISTIRGMNSRLDELQAAVLRVKLRHLESSNEIRVLMAREYDTRLANTPLALPKVRLGATHVYHQYVIRHTLRDELRGFLQRQGIASLIHYPVPVHLQPAYSDLGELGELPTTVVAARTVLSLPMFPETNLNEIDGTIKTILDWLHLLKAS